MVFRHRIKYAGKQTFDSFGTTEKFIGYGGRERFFLFGSQNNSRSSRWRTVTNPRYGFEDRGIFKDQRQFPSGRGSRGDKLRRKEFRATPV